MLTAQDERLEALSRWLEGQTAVTGLDLTTVTPASADASFRRYFRVQGEGHLYRDGCAARKRTDRFVSQG